MTRSIDWTAPWGPWPSDLDCALGDPAHLDCIVGELARSTCSLVGNKQ